MTRDPLALPGTCSRLGLTLALTAGIATAQVPVQMPTPPQVATSTSEHGFWFRAPIPFEITSIEAVFPWSTPGPYASQSVSVRKFSGIPSGSGTMLFSSNGGAINSPISCSIQVQSGDYICITEFCSDILPPFWPISGSAVATGGFASNVLDHPVTLMGASVNSGSVTNHGAANLELGCLKVYIRHSGQQATRQTFGTGCQGLAQFATARPAIGTTITLRTANLPPATAFGATIQGLTGHNPGIDLSSYGMTGCHQYASTDIVEFWTPSFSIGTTSFVIPPTESLVGLPIYTQGAAFKPGINAAGAIVSNGVKLTVGY